MSEDFFGDVSTLKTKSVVLASNKMARMAYTSNAYANDDAAGVDVYSTNNEQNVPSIAAVDVNSTVIDRGLRSQAVSLPRNFINHFYGRASYNLNKIVDWFDSLLSSLARMFAKNGNFYTDTTKYLKNDVCCMQVTESTIVMVKSFIRTTDNPVELVGVPPLDGGGVLSSHWALLRTTDTVTQTQGNNSTKVASTAYVDTAITNALAAALTAAKNACIPINFLYTQLPGMSDPATLWPFATWSNVSNYFAGGFFRAEGGHAAAFGGGAQGSANLSHTHVTWTGGFSAQHQHGASSGWMDRSNPHGHTSYGTYGTGSGSTPRIGNDTGTAYGYIAGTDINHLHAIYVGDANADHTHGVGMNGSGEVEARPYNYSVRIWRRTA